MKKKRRLRKLTGCVFVILILCTALARQFKALLLPQVMTAALEPGKVIHRDSYPAVADGWTVSWVVDSQGYGYYADVTKAELSWMDADGQKQTDILRITDKQKKRDGTWTFFLDAEKISAEAGSGMSGTLQVSMQSEISYPYTLPVSALSKDGDGYMVFAVQTKQGLFSDEQTVWRVPQTVLDQDSYTAAVSSGWAGRVAVYTSRPLADDMRVVVVE